MLDLAAVGRFKVERGIRGLHCLRARLANQMTRVFKTLLLCLMIGTLPLQAIAVVVSASCGPGQRLAAHAATASKAAQADAANAHRAAHDMSQHAKSDGSAHQSSVPDTKHNPACSNISVACCAGAAAPPPTAPLFALHRDAELVVNTAAVLPAGFVPAIPERPPRSILA